MKYNVKEIRGERYLYRYDQVAAKNGRMDNAHHEFWSRIEMLEAQLKIFKEQTAFQCDGARFSNDPKERCGDAEYCIPCGIIQMAEEA